MRSFTINRRRSAEAAALPGIGPGQRGRALLPFLLVLASGCAARAAAAPGEPVPDPAGTAEALTAATTPTERRQVTFGWTLEEAGSRVRGRGVVRLQPPDRLRLDLFGPRNETYLAAALVGDEAKLPPAARSDVVIPSPALLWAGLGVIRPPRNSTLQAATASGEVTVLRYRADDGEVYEYSVANAPAPRLEQLQRIGSRGPLETVRLAWSEAGELSRANYRDWSAFRDLRLEIESNVAAEEFPEVIWSP